MKTKYIRGGSLFRHFDRFGQIGKAGIRGRRGGGLARAGMAAAMALSCAAALGAPDVTVGQGALDQIGALLVEKASWTPVQAKLDSELIHALKNHRGEKFAAGAPSLRLGVEMQPDGRVLVDIKAEVTGKLLSLINGGGGSVVNSFAQFNAVRALVTLDQLETLAGMPEVSFIQRAVGMTACTGSVDSQGDVTHLAGAARSAFGVSGAGITVGVISSSVDYLAVAQSTGDLGPVNVLPGQSGVPSTGEGTAMLEIVHDLAPAAPLYFATAINGEASFAYNILNLWSNGCNIIIDDVFYYDESPFQDGILAQAVNTVTAGGALYFSAAGNSGNLDAGTSGTWEGDFVDGGPAGAPIPEAARLHSFGPATYDTITNAGYHLDLFWSDPLAGSSNDYDLFLLDSNGVNVVASSMNRQTGTQDPYENIGYMQTGERVVVVKYSGAPRFLHLNTQEHGQLRIATSGATVGHSAATNAFSVSATPAAAPVQGEPAGPFPNPFNSNNIVEFFTSDGPRHVFYNADGSAITPGDVSATGGAIRLKPDITAANGVVTTLPASTHLNPFFGTSAAAPHAGAIAALIWSYDPTLTPAQIRSLLTSTAIDIGRPGMDRDSGWGIVMAYPALTNLTGMAPPGINLQPSNQTVRVGGTATFSVTVVGEPPFSYTWERNGTPIAGATASTYITNNVQVADSGSQFSCVVSNAQAAMTSSNGTLTILEPPANDRCSGATIITSANYTNVESTLTATTTGDPVPPCAYAFTNGVWYQYTPPSDGQLVVDTIASDFTTDLALYTGTCGSFVEVACGTYYGTLYATPPITYTVSGGVVYRILAGGDSGASGNLVFHLSFTSFSGPPNITNQPANETVPADGSASFSVSVLGSPPLSYFWSRNGALITGATNSTYTTNNVQVSDSGAQFSCLVSNAFGMTNSASALLTVYTCVPAATVAYVRTALDRQAEEGGVDNDGILTMVFGSGWQDLRYETVDASALFSPALRFIFMEGGSDTTDTEPAMASFLNANMSAMTNWVAAGGSLFIDAAPQYTNNYSVNLGFGASLNVGEITEYPSAADPAHPIFSGPYVPAGTLFYGNFDWFGYATVSGAGLSAILLSESQSQSAVLAESGYGSGHLLFGGMTLPYYQGPQPEASNLLANLLVYGANLGSTATNSPPVLFSPLADVSGQAGASATFSVDAGGAPPLSYFWSRNGEYIAGATNSDYTTNNVQPADTGAQFSCVVSNAYGWAASSNATLRVSLVKNGGFETGTFTNWALSVMYDAVVTTFSGAVHSGSYGAELDAYQSLGFLSQNLPTTIGGSYVVSLWLDNPEGLTPNQFEVYWHGATLYNRINLPATSWTNLQFLVTAIASSTALEFAFRDDSAYLGLDDISVVQELLQITPGTGIVSTGYVGGPFSITNSFVLTNAANSPLSWGLANTSAWCNASSGGGVIAPGAGATVAVSLNAGAAGLPVGNYTNTIWFTNLNDGVVQSRQFALKLIPVPEPLQITPTNLVFSRPNGGSFSVTSQDFTLTNVLTTPLNWSLASTSLWFSALPGSGALSSDAAASVTVTLADAAASLPAGDYTNTLWFTNLSDSSVQSRQVLFLTVPLVLNGGFETGDFSDWTEIGSFADCVVSSSPLYAHSGNFGAEMGPSGALSYLSQTLPTTAGQPYLFSLWLDSPDGATPNVFQVSWNGTMLLALTNLGVTGWTNLQFLVTATGPATVIQLGFRDDASYLGLDDVSVVPAPVPAFQAVGKSGNLIMLSWSAQAGLSYQLQYATDLGSPDWTNLGSGITATNTTITLSDPILPGGNDRRFYRVILLP